MQISGSGTPPLFRLSLAPQALKSLPLKAGETLTATVKSSDNAGNLTLEISGKLLQAVSTLRLAAGMSLQLQVEKSNGQLLLQLDDKTLQKLTQNQAFRQNLPQQEPLKPLIERLQQLMATNGKASTASPPTDANAVAKQGNTEVNAPAAAVKQAIASASETLTSGKAAAVSREPGETTAKQIPADSGKTTPTTSAPPLPRSVRQAIERLMAILPTLKQISDPGELKQTIANSGLFLENTLTQPQRANASDKDVKTALLRLARVIRQNLATESGGKQADLAHTKETMQALLRQVDSGLSRIQLHQLHALNTQQAQGDEKQIVTMELPLLQPQEKNIEMLQLKIQREKSKRGSGAADSWSVTLHINPADYGDIHAVVSLVGGKVSTTFWCQEAQTGELFRQQLDELQQRFDEQGLEVGRCTAITGSPPKGISTDSDTELAGLIDTRA